MNPTSNTFDPAAEDQASLWAARLDGSDLSTADRRALDAWLAQDPSHRTLLTSYCQFSSDLERRLPALAAGNAFDVPPTAGTSGRRWSRWIGLGGLAAAAAIAVTVWLRPAESAERAVATPVGQRRTLTLDDGTQVELNAQTSLRIDVSSRQRHVLLASGEAYFSVHKDPSRPFIVETPAGSVRVTGTHFNVRSESTSDLEVTVAEGSVQARPNGAAGATSTPYALTACDQLSAGKAGVTLRRLSAADLDNALAWRDGQVVFDRVRLQDALARFARYHGRGIVVTPAVADLSVGGRYSLDDLDGFLSFIEDGLGVRVTREPNGTLQVSERSPR